MWWGFGGNGFRVIWLALIPESLNNRGVRHNDLHKTPCRHLIPHKLQKLILSTHIEFSLSVLSVIACDGIIKEHTLRFGVIAGLINCPLKWSVRGTAVRWLPVYCCGSKRELALRSDNTVLIINTRDKSDFRHQTQTAVTSVYCYSFLNGCSLQ